MGNDNAKGKRAAEADRYGQVYLQLNSDTFHPGDTVKGTIYINLKSVYPGDKLCLKVKGKEFTKWIDKEARTRNGPDGQPETYYVDVPRQGELDHIRNVVDVYDWAFGANLPPGQFEFPIQFTIPKGIPSSFFLRRGNVVGEIRYYIEAYLKPDYDKFPKIKFKRDVIIKEILNQQVQTKEVSMNKEITTCCCFGQGNVSMKTYFEKNAYHPGETARIVTEVDNSQCKLDVTSVNFSLVQTVTLRAQNHQRVFNFTIRTANLGNIPAGQSFVGQNRKEAQIDLPPPIEGNAKAFKGDKTVEEYSVDPSMAMSPSTNGNLVKSNFDLRVFCGMDACCMCDGIPGTSLPINVYSLIQQKMTDPVPPQGWNPKAMPSATLSITINVGGQTIQINQGGEPGNPIHTGMVNNNQMPPQQNMNQSAPFQNQPQQNNYNNQPPQNNYNQPPQNNQPQYNNQPPQNNQQPQYNNNQPQNNQYNNQPQNNQPHNNQPQNYNNNQQQGGFNNQQPQYNNNQPQNNQPQNYNNNQPPQNNYNNNNNNNNQQPQNNYNNSQPQNNQPNYNNNQPQNNQYNNQPPQNNQQPQYNNNQPQNNQYNNQPQNNQPQNYNNNQQQGGFNNQQQGGFNNQPQQNYNNQPQQNYNNQPQGGFNNQPNYNNNQPQNINPNQVSIGGPRY